MQDIITKIRDNPRFHALMRRRNNYAIFMTALIMLAYYGYILLIAFNKDFLAQKIGSGVTSIGIPLGVGVIVFTMVITAIYVRRANTEFDAESESIVEEARQ